MLDYLDDLLDAAPGTLDDLPALPPVTFEQEPQS